MRALVGSVGSKSDGPEIQDAAERRSPVLRGVPHPGRDLEEAVALLGEEELAEAPFRRRSLPPVVQDDTQVSGVNVKYRSDWRLCIPSP